MYKIPNKFKLTYDKDCIANAVDKIASKMNDFFSDEKFKDDDILILTILNGAIYFAADLTRKLTIDAEVASVKVSSYVNNKQAADLHIQGNIDVTNKVVILLDEICDSGRTFEVLSNKIKEMGAKDVYSASLLFRESNDRFIPTFSGIVYKGDDWFVGYGMDDSKRFRHLPEIYIIKEKAK